jgi:PAS domain S-box-containing protein
MDRIEKSQYLQIQHSQEEQLRLALASAQMGLWDWDLLTGQIYWNREHEQLFGLIPGSFDGTYETFDRLIHPEDRGAVHQFVVNAIENRQITDRAILHHQFRIVWGDGSIHWIETRGEAHFDRSWQPVRMIGVVVNIDDLYQVQQILQAQLDRQLEQQRLLMDLTRRIKGDRNLREILQTTVDEIRQFLQIDRVVVYQFAPNWSGSIIVESVGTDWEPILTAQNSKIYAPCSLSSISNFQQGLAIANADIYNAEIDDLHLQLLENLQFRANLVIPIFKVDKLWGLLIAHHCADSRQWLTAEIDLIQQLVSQISIAIQQSYLFDLAQCELTQRQQIERKLQLLNADIAQHQSVEKLKSEFIGIVSHELRTPLTSMQGALGLLAMGLMDDEPAQMKQMIEIASIETERLVRMVNNILDLDKLDADASFLEREWCDATALIQKAIDVMIASAAAAGVDLALNCRLAKIWVSPDRLVQVLTNLLGNAIKFSPPNSTISIEAKTINAPLQTSTTPVESNQPSLTNSSHQLYFAVKDCGRGIPADKLDSIFGRFQQVDASDARDKGGTGLGLSICKSIVEQHQGLIWAESHLGSGSTFIFTLPQPIDKNSVDLGTL